MTFEPFYFDGSQEEKDGLNTSVQNMENWGRLVAAAIEAGMAEMLPRAQLGHHQRVRGLPTFGFKEQDDRYDGETLAEWLKKQGMTLITVTVISASTERM